MHPTSYPGPGGEPVELDLERWQLGPQNRWAYQHVPEFLDTAPVRRGPDVSPLPSSPVSALDDLVFDRGDGRATTLARFLDDGYVDGLAVASDGVLVLERYRNGMTPDSLHLSQSVAKSVLGLLCGVLVERGVIGLDDPVTRWVPEVAGSGYRDTRLHHLLDMVAAVDFAEEYAGDFWKFDIACGWHPPVGDEARSVLEYLPSIGPAPWAHGERFRYVTPDTDLAGILVERACGARLADVISEHLWAPLGAEREAALTVDPVGTAVVGGGFCATLRDYTRLGQLVLDGGRGVVPQHWVDRLGRGSDDAFARTPAPAVTSGAQGYASFWWRRDDRLLARGIHGQLVAVDPASRTVVTVLSSWPTATDAVLEAGNRALVSAVCEALGPGGP